MSTAAPAHAIHLAKRRLFMPPPPIASPPDRPGLEGRPHGSEMSRCISGSITHGHVKEHGSTWVWMRWAEAETPAGAETPASAKAPAGAEALNALRDPPCG
jgi:hypothetical protein